MLSETELFSRIPYSELPQLADYLSPEDLADLRQILERVLNHRIDTEEHSTIPSDQLGGFDHYVGWKAEALEAGRTPDSDERRVWAEKVGTSQEDLQALSLIGERFTAAYNQKNRSQLTAREGRAILLEMAEVQSIGRRVNALSEQRRFKIRERQVNEYLKKHIEIIPVTELQSHLEATSMRAWERLPNLDAYCASGSEYDFRLYFKTETGDYGRATLLPAEVPLVVSGHVIRDRETMFEYLERYTKLTLFVPRFGLNGRSINDISGLVRLFADMDEAVQNQRAASI